MFGFLKKKFSKSQGDKNKSERDIFEYFDGTRTRCIDPIAAYESLRQECGDDPVVLLKTIATNPPPGPPGVDVSAFVEKFNKKRDLCTHTLSKAACVAFDVKEFGEDENGKRFGLTRAERIALVREFLYYLGGLALKARPFENS